MTPAADLHESEHAARVLQALRAEIAAAGGWLSFDEYMDIALYAPGLGYYSAGAHKLGQGGDFTTAPEISPLFGACLARHCDEVLTALGGDKGRGSGGEILEVGAGSGRLAFDVLTALSHLGRVPARYRILEISADLRERQRQLLSKLPPSLSSRVEWIDEPPSRRWEGALLANEVLDALPVSSFSWRAGELFERGVAMGAEGDLRWSEQPARAVVRKQIERLRKDATSGLGIGGEPEAAWPDGFVSEYCARVEPWIATVTGSMSCGVALLIDYGLPRHEYYHGQRSSGTLRCHYRQRAHDNPFAHPGMEDITAWVDFTRVAEAADSAGLVVLGYATQAAVLLGLGIEAEVSVASDERTRIRRAMEARQLLMPTEMGETFKCMALGRNWSTPLTAFAHQDLRHSL